jgi:hypothetical protein
VTYTPRGHASANPGLDHNLHVVCILYSSRARAGDAVCTGADQWTCVGGAAQRCPKALQGPGGVKRRHHRAGIFQ